MLSSAAQWLYRINPNLCQDPPRATMADDEYCYCGIAGGDSGGIITTTEGEGDGAVLCQEIGYAHATCVGSWMLSPEHHIVEGIVVTILSLWIIRMVSTSLNNNDDNNNNNNNNNPTTTSTKFRHPPGSKILSLFCFGMILCYKYYGYPMRLFYVVMPCNMNWALSFVQCFCIPELWTKWQVTLLQMRISYLMSVIIAIVLPETDDCVLPGEYIFYWFNHYVLLILPFAYIVNGSVSCFPSPSHEQEQQQSTKTTTTPSAWTFNVLWWAYSCAAFGIFYFIPVTVMAIYSGLNLNFMLHPPIDHPVLSGKWYRLITIGLLATCFALSRLLAFGVEKNLLNHNSFLSTTSSTTTTTTASKKNT